MLSPNSQDKSGQTPQQFSAAVDRIGEESPLVSIAEYRKMIGDSKSTDEQVLKRLKYMESLCRHIIQQELGIQKHE